MHRTGVYFVSAFAVFIVSSAMISAGALPFRRTSIFKDSDIPRRRYEELIAGRQIRNSLHSLSKKSDDNKAVSGSSVVSSPPAAGSLQFHAKPPSQVFVALNDRLELLCDVSGAPPPAIYWLKNGHPIRESPYDAEELTNRILETESTLPTRGLASTKSRLVIDCVDVDVEAIYTCVAESINEKVIASTYVHIEGEAPYNETTCSLKHETDSLPASIFMWSGTYIDVEGKEATLLCRAAGNPAPRITWLDGDDQPIENGLNYQIMWTGDLKIRNLSWKDNMGLYRCRAENMLGHDETATFVYPVVPES